MRKIHWWQSITILNSVEALFKEFPEQNTAIIVEPVAGNMGVVPPVKGFLSKG